MKCKVNIEKIKPYPLEGLGKSHDCDCKCVVCSRVGVIYDELKVLHSENKRQNGSRVNHCKVFKEEASMSSKESTLANELKDLDEEHEPDCVCMYCNIIKTISKHFENDQKAEKIDEKGSTSKEKVDDVPILNLDMVEEELETFVVCDPKGPLVLRVKDGVVYSMLNVNTGEVKTRNPYVETKTTNNEEDIPQKGDVKVGEGEKVQEAAVFKLKLKLVNNDEMLDHCLCQPGKLNALCVKHSVAYSQDMSVRLATEGCTCNELRVCSYCEKMNCIDCRHEREDFMSCPQMTSNDSIQLEQKVSSWLDGKLNEAGLSHLWNQEDRIEHSDSITEESLLDELTMSLKNNILDRWENLPSQPDFILTEPMKQEIINIDDMFDVRPWPRCYRLKGKKDSNEEVVGIEEEMNDSTLEMWKHPTQYPEDTFPLGCNIPDVDSQAERESEIRLKMTGRIQKAAEQRSRPKDRVVGLNENWKPIVEPRLKDSDEEGFVSALKSKEAKINACEEMFQKVDESCNKLWGDDEEVPCYSEVQKILDKYCEESVEWKGITCQDVNFIDDLEKYIEKEFESIKDWVKWNEGKGVGYKKEFWMGLENWRPDAQENQVRKTVLNELEKFLKQMAPLKESSGDPISEDQREILLNKLFESLPQHKDVLQKIRSDMRGEDFTTEGLHHLEKKVFGKFLNRPMEDEGSSENSELQNDEKEDNEDDDFVDEMADDGDLSVLKSLKKINKYDDEEDEEVETIISEINEKWIKETEQLIESVEDPEQAAKVQEEMKNRLTKVLDVEPSPSPYCREMAEIMIKKNPKGLNAAQKFWLKEPSFPFWTPTTLYNFDETEKLIFGNNDYPKDESDYDESALSELEKKLLALTIYEDEFTQEQGEDAENDVQEESSEKEDEAEEELSADEEFLDQPLNANLRQQSSKISLNLDQMMKGIAGKVTSSEMSYAIRLDTKNSVNFNAIVPSPAHSWNFPLDTFQKQSIIALEAGLNVFVLAHTSAGKTVTAEYAIGMANRMGSKIVYTSPIKALSNQKFKDFKDTFKDKISVGIITGDIQLNEEAQCLIMTTEILRSMLINNSNLLHDLQFVIFDEVHYFNDPERGNVWEEVFIRLPSSCQLVMLSATVLGPMQFASWIGNLKKKTVVVTSTPHRPVPLNHYLHVGTTKSSVPISHLIKKAEGNFEEKNFKLAMDLKKALEKSKKSVKPTKKKIKDLWVNFVQGHLQAKKRLPAVIFSLSRKMCDKLARNLSVVDLTSDVEKEIIKDFIAKSISKLEDHDRKIQQIVEITSLLIRGIGVHHSGILPILKEIVECLFQNGQVKLLFATETFAMGVNMPAKTVVFDRVKKYDGDDWRPLTTAEYTQMAGRAGRRGKDKSGTVIILDWFKDYKTNNEQKQQMLIKMLTGSVQSLESQFKLRYSLILDMQQPRGDLDMESLMTNSYRNQPYKKKLLLCKMQSLSNKINDVYEKSIKNMPVPYKEVFCKYHELFDEYIMVFKQVRFEMLLSLQKFLKRNRIIVVCYPKFFFVYGIILDVKPCESNPSKTVYQVLTLKESCFETPPIKQSFPEVTEEQEFKWNWMLNFKMRDYNLSRSKLRGLQLIEINGHHIHRVTDKECIIRGEILSILRQPSYSQAKSQGYLNDVMHYINLFFQTTQIHCLDDMRFVNVAKFNKLFQLENDIVNLKFPPDCGLLDKFQRYFIWKELSLQEQTMNKDMEGETSMLKQEYESKLRVLQELEYLDKNNLMTMKGNIARRMNNYEVFVTELLFKNILQKLNSSETAALLSCLVFQGKMKTEESKDIVNERKMLDLPDHFIHGTKGKQVYHALKVAKMDALNEIQNENVKVKFKSEESLLNKNLQEAIDVAEKLKLELIEKEDKQGAESDIKKLTFNMAPIMYSWAQGETFEKVMKLTREIGGQNIQEGILVRWIQQLIETIRGIESAARLMGDPEVISKLQGAVVALKRGIVFTPSLYLD